MAKYVNLDDVIEHLELHWGYEGLREDLYELPTADVVPVRHGRWIEEGSYQICSECGEEHAWDEYRAAYCGDCGARMDGGADNCVCKAL